MMKKCPRCENENIKEDYKYCPICGIKLGTAQEPVQEQSEEISNSELLVLLITIESLTSKAIQGLRSSEPLYKTTT